MYFITVDRCNAGKRGIFCSKKGGGFLSLTQHTVEEMREILGIFYIILNPKSTLFTELELKKFNKWIPLAEYKNEYGIAIEGD